MKKNKRRVGDAQQRRSNRSAIPESRSNYPLIPQQGDGSSAARAGSHAVLPEWQKKAQEAFEEGVFISWIEPLKYQDGIVTCPSSFHMERIVRDYHALLKNSLEVSSIKYVVSEGREQCREA